MISCGKKGDTVDNFVELNEENEKISPEIRENSF